MNWDGTRQTCHVQDGTYLGELSDNPQHPSLHFKQLSGRGGRFSVRIGIHYRVVGWKPDASTVEWVWIGSHADYDKLIG